MAIEITTGKLTAKLMEEKLKKGWSTSDFADYLGMTTDEFKAALDKIFYGPAARNYRRRLKKNDKHVEQQLNRRACSTKINVSHVEEVYEEPTITTEKDVIEAQESEKDFQIKELSKKEILLKKEIISLENLHKTEVANRKTVCEDILVIQDAMLKLKKELEAYREKATELLRKKEQISANLERINAEKATSKEDLSRVQEEICELRKIEVNIVDDIEIIPPEYNIPEGWKELRNSWIDDERFSNLTVMELSLLAKAILLKNLISEDGRKSEFVFASDHMEELFNELS